MNPDQSDPFVPQLREAELQLDSALGEACDRRPSGDADTGDLIRLDELLANAADATKRAISLRRKRRVDRSQGVERAASIGDVEAAARPVARHRVVVDARGVQWDVFAVHPEPSFAVQSKLKGPYSEGWLCFDAGAEKRRLSPIPADWQTMAERQLATSRTGPRPRPTGAAARRRIRGGTTGGGGSKRTIEG